MKGKDIDNKEIKLDLTINIFPKEIKERLLSRVSEDEEFTEESLKTFIEFVANGYIPKEFISSANMGATANLLL